MSYDNTNKGAIWKNDNRERDTQPHFKGNLDVDGVEYYVNAWKREEGAHPNAPALKFSITKKSDVQNKAMNQAQNTMQQPPQQMAPPPPPEGGPFDDNIPFIQHEKYMVV
jgi:hypothetical protein